MQTGKKTTEGAPFQTLQELFKQNLTKIFSSYLYDNNYKSLLAITSVNWIHFQLNVLKTFEKRVLLVRWHCSEICHVTCDFSVMLNEVLSTAGCYNWCYNVQVQH